MTKNYRDGYSSKHGGPSRRTSGTSADGRPKRSLGQNFLQDANIARKIVRTLEIGPEDSVLEIGPGPGALTGVLMDGKPARLVLVEKDRHWARERAEQGGNAVSVLLADALLMPWERFREPWKLIGNLPYNVASPLMWEIFSRASGLERAVFMIQKEVGQRIAAQPGTSAYGALSVWIQSFMRPKMEFIVPPHVFRPQPKVDSAVLSFVPLTPAGAGGERHFEFEPKALAATLKHCFQMRRKQLGSIVRSLGGKPERLEEAGVDPRVRPEELAPEVFHKLAGIGILTGKH